MICRGQTHDKEEPSYRKFIPANDTSTEIRLQLAEDGVVGGVAADLLDVDELLELVDELFEVGVFLHTQPDPASGRVRQGHTESAVAIESAAGEESGHVGERAGMVVYDEFRNFQKDSGVARPPDCALRRGRHKAV